MKPGASMDLVRDLLDREILDSEHESCGMVDDLELEQRGETLVVVALLVGPGAWQMRLPALVRLLIRAFTGREIRRLSLEEIDAISDVVNLRSPASQVGLGVVDRRVGQWLKRVAGA